MTQKEKIIAIMIRGKRDWWHAEDLMADGEIFVGYKAQARVSELAIDYPEMIERTKSTKGNAQHMYRFRFENVHEFLPNLPPKLARFVRQELIAVGRTEAKVWRTRYERVDNGTVRPIRELVPIDYVSKENV